jgi:hypothetical protein
LTASRTLEESLLARSALARRSSADRDVERDVARFEALAERDDLLGRHVELRGELLIDEAGVERARHDLRLLAPQAEKDLGSERSGPHADEAVGTNDVVEDERADPVGCVRDEAGPAVGVELAERRHQPDVSLRNKVRHGQPIPPVTEGDRHHVAQVRRNELLASFLVGVVTEPHGERVLFLAREARDLLRPVHVPRHLCGDLE